MARRYKYRLHTYMDNHDKYQVVCDLLQDYCAPFYNMIQAEKKKDKPSLVIIEYCERRIDALVYVEKKISSNDEKLLDQILISKDLFRTP